MRIDPTKESVDAAKVELDMILDALAPFERSRLDHIIVALRARLQAWRRKLPSADTIERSRVPRPD